MKLAQDIRNVGDYGVTTGVNGAQLAELLTWADEFLLVAQAFLQEVA